MRIVILTGIFPPEIGGPAIYTERLARELSKKGNHVKIITYGKSKGDYPFKVVYISKKWPKVLRHIIFFIKTLKESAGSDLIYAQNLFSVGIPGLMVSKILKKKFVAKIVGDYVWEKSLIRGWTNEGIDGFQSVRSWRINFLKWLQLEIAKRADILITPSNYLKGIIIGWGVSEGKIRVVYNAPEEIPQSDLSKKESQKEINIKGDLLLSIGRLSPWKGFSCLVGVMAELIKENSNFKLLIVGDGEERGSIEKKIRDLGLENNVFLLGKILHKKLAVYFKAADIFVLNTGYEGFPHVILEAMESGSPVITTKKGGNIEVIEDGATGMLVEYNNREEWKEAILRLWRDEGLRNKFIEESRRKVKEFNWDNLVKQTLEVLKSV
jgi:glycosyltransferase involved in cell wall biosynthesis